MSEFAYLVRPAFDRAFDVRANDAERGFLNAHWEFLLALNRAGRLVYAGRCYDRPFGIVVFTAENEQDARSTTQCDPSVAQGVQPAELFPFKSGLVGRTA